MTKIEKYLNAIDQLPAVETARKAKAKILNRPDLLELFDRLRKEQKLLVRKFATQSEARYDAESKSYLDMLNTIQSQPLIEEYLIALEEVQESIDFLSNILKAPNLEL